jgi:hypothetical protein
MSHQQAPWLSIEFDAKLREFERGTLASLHVVCDFDSTLTLPGSPHSWSAGKCSALLLLFVCCCCCAHARTLARAVERYPQFSATYRERAWALRRHFLAIESQPLSEVPRARKQSAMCDWWRMALALVIDERPTRGTLRAILRQLPNFALRDGADAFLRELNRRGVPVTLLSAGIGDMIVLMLAQADLLLPNIKICSNFARFASDDDDAPLVGWRRGDAPLHSMNKSMRALETRRRRRLASLFEAGGDATMCSRRRRFDWRRADGRRHRRCSGRVARCIFERRLVMITYTCTLISFFFE